MARERKRVLVAGLVQGVYFRQTARCLAEQAGLTGWVRNRLDGRVEAVVEGDPAAVEKFVAWCRRGPPGAVVRSVEAQIEPLENEVGTFSVRPTA